MNKRGDGRLQQDEKFELHLDLMGILRRRFLLIAFGTLAGAAIAEVYLKNQKPIYEAYLTVLVGQLSSEMASTGIRDSSSGGVTLKDEILATHVELFRSPKILQQAIDQHNLDHSVDQLQENLAINKGGEGPGEDASLLTATFRDTDPDSAAMVLHSIFDTYQDYIDDQSRHLGAEAAKLIGEALTKNEQALRDADKAYREFVESVPALTSLSGSGVGELQDTHRTRLKAIEGELAKVRSAIASAVSRRNVISQAVKGRKPEEFTDAELMTLLNQEDLSRLQSLFRIAEERRTVDSELEMARRMTNASSESKMLRLMDLLSQRRVMQTTYGLYHPSVVALEAEIASVQKFDEQQSAETEGAETSDFSVPPADILKAHYTVLRNDINALSKREQELLALSEQESQMAKEVELGFLKGNVLKANLDRAQRRYDEVFKRFQEINLTNDYAGFSTDLLVQPQPAQQPVWPSKSKVILVGLMGGLMVGFGLAWIAEKGDDTFRNPCELEAAVGAPILAHFPILKPSQLRRSAIEGSGIDPVVTTFHTPRTTDAETLRVVRTAIVSLAKQQHKQVFLVTSPSPLDGKSTVISNVAVSMAQAGKRVLLIDGDLRRPTIASVFGLDREPGLTDFLNSDRDFQDCLHDSEQLNLSVCPSGNRTSVPSELLESDHFVEFLNQARRSFDMIFVDAPPVLAVTDPSIIATHTDGCLMVVQVGKNNQSRIKRAAELLHDQKTPIDGVIVNSQGPRRRGYGYSSYNYFGKSQYGYLESYRRYYEPESPNETPGLRQVGNPVHRMDERAEQAGGKSASGGLANGRLANGRESKNGKLVSEKR